MKVIRVTSPSEGALLAYSHVKQSLEKGATTFGLATGGTPEELYALIRESDLDFSKCVSINLDEYVGLTPDNQKSYHYYMKENLFKVKPFKESFIPQGWESDATKEVSRYEDILKKYPIDFQLLGLGTNGHIGFNEPGTPFTQRTHKVALTKATVEANKRYFDKVEDVPTFAYSMGLANIMEAKEIVLLAFGHSKAEAIKALVEGEQTTNVPATILQSHENVTIIIDADAASLLSETVE
ncbi:glucosamine-6-phosphate deaminase [Carnobacteriaceae bacterium zg-ZUI240]|nr:glucosamine-6-phosphate deaminase [Carnobacteriaceae bacterium zg-ZUI240]